MIEQHSDPKFKVTLIALVVLLSALIFSSVAFYSYKAGARDVGEKLVHAFYTFDLPTIAENDKQIQKLTTKDIYERFTISSSARQLRVYLKFEGKPTEAKIIGHHGDTIYFYIDSEGFDPDRTFAIKYKYRWGKITEVAEMEVFLLPQTIRSDLK